MTSALLAREKIFATKSERAWLMTSCALMWRRRCSFGTQPLPTLRYLHSVCAQRARARARPMHVSLRALYATRSVMNLQWCSHSTVFNVLRLSGKVDRFRLLCIHYIE